MAAPPPPLFAPPFRAPLPGSARAAHTVRLHDALQLALAASDATRARRAYAALVRCPGAGVEKMWRLGAQVLRLEGAGREVEFLRAVRLQRPEECEAVMIELVGALIEEGNEREALDELELYLPSFPYHDNAALHLYAGMLCLRLSQGNGAAQSQVRAAQTYFERARVLQPAGGALAQAWLNRTASLLADDGGSTGRGGTGAGSGGESDDEDGGSRAAKRARSSVMDD